MPDSRTAAPPILSAPQTYKMREQPSRRSPDMKKFLVLYLAPTTVLDDWMRKDPKEREAAEKKMQQEWQRWSRDHAKIFDDEDAGVGKTKVVNPQGVSDSRNDVMLYATVEADSHDEAAKLFKDHPHLQIPQATIEIMEVRSHSM
jgi:hypothetical protein